MPVTCSESIHDLGTHIRTCGVGSSSKKNHLPAGGLGGSSGLCFDAKGSLRLAAKKGKATNQCWQSSGDQLNHQTHQTSLNWSWMSTYYMCRHVDHVAFTSDKVLSPMCIYNVGYRLVRWTSIVESFSKNNWLSWRWWGWGSFVERFFSDHFSYFYQIFSGVFPYVLRFFVFFILFQTIRCLIKSLLKNSTQTIFQGCTPWAAQILNNIILWMVPFCAQQLLGVKNISKNPKPCPHLSLSKAGPFTLETHIYVKALKFIIFQIIKCLIKPLLKKRTPKQFFKGVHHEWPRSSII